MQVFYCLIVRRMLSDAEDGRSGKAGRRAGDVLRPQRAERWAGAAEGAGTLSGT